MAKEQGRVVKLVGTKPFGFIRRPDGSELFFHFSKYPNGVKPAVGDELEYEVEINPSKPAGKQDFAAAITVVKKSVVAAPPPPAATAAAANAPSPAISQAPPEPLDAKVDFLYDQKELRTSSEELFLPVVLKVYRPNGQPLHNAVLQIWCSKVPFPNADGDYWFTTNKDGEVSVPLGLERGYDQITGQPGPSLEDTKLYLEAKVTFGGKALLVSEIVPRSKDMLSQFVPPPPQPPPPPPPKPALSVQESNTADGKQYLASYGTPDATTSATFEVWPTRGCDIEVRDDTQGAWQTTTGGKLVFPSSGQSVLNVRIKKLAPSVGGEKIFIGVQGKTDKSGPHYISGIK